MLESVKYSKEWIFQIREDDNYTLFYHRLENRLKKDVKKIISIKGSENLPSQ
jgi:hypothetical protein